MYRLKKYQNLDFLIMLLFFFINFHILRVINIYFGLITYLLYSLIFFSIFIYKEKIDNKASKSLVFITTCIFIIYFIFLNYSLLADFNVKSKIDWMYLGKINFTYPLVIILILHVQKIIYFKNLISVYLLFNILSALFLLGSVFFDNNSFIQNQYFSFKIRDGLERYSTLYGSVAQTGYSLSIPLIISLMMKIKNNYKIIILTILCIGATLSLSRSGYYNIFLSFLMYTLFFPDSYKNKLKFLTLCLCSVFVLTPIILILFGLFDYYNHFLFTLFKINIIGVDYSLAVNPPVFNNFYDRVFYSLFNDLLSIAKNNFTAVNQIIFGVGYKGLGISLGMFQSSSNIYIHNGIYEILISGGIVFFLLFIFLMVSAIYKLFKYDLSIANNESRYFNRLFIASIITIFINLMLGASIIHPNLISFFWMIISYVIIVEKNNYVFKKEVNLTGGYEK